MSLLLLLSPLRLYRSLMHPAAAAYASSSSPALADYNTLLNLEIGARMCKSSDADYSGVENAPITLSQTILCPQVRRVEATTGAQGIGGTATAQPGSYAQKRDPRNFVAHEITL